MSFQHIPGVGVVHFQEVKPPRVVPAAERHKWNKTKLQRGQAATCLKCGAQKCYRFNYDTVYRLAGSTDVLTERPACTGKQINTVQPSNS